MLDRRMYVSSSRRAVLTETVSIENAVTTKRRAEKADRARDRAKKTRVRSLSKNWPC